MSSTLANALDSLKHVWNNISMYQRMFIAGLATIMVAVFIALVIWLARPEFIPLYTNLSNEDASRVIKNLDTKKIPYRIEQDGAAIMVPADKAHLLRISIAGENLITGQGVGFEIFNDIKIGQTDFVQKLNYRRALEGELSRTISQFPGVEGARVHLVMPSRSLFIEEQQKPSASVLLQVSGGKKIEPKDVHALVNLVTMAVEGLDKTRVSVADNSGKVLYQPEEEGSLLGLNQTQFDHKMQVQRNIERRIEELLLPIIGAGKVVARVNVDLDYSQKTIRKELYDPEKTVVRSEIRNEENTQGKANLESGVPDPNFRGDGLTGNTSTQNSNRESRTTNFEINKEEQNIVSTMGGVNRLTVAVIVDGTYEKNAQGQMQFVPRQEDEVKRIRQLVSNAVGLDTTRGDTIEVSNIAFGGIELAEPPSLAGIIADYAVRFGKPLLNALLVFLFLVLVVRPVVLALIRPKVEGRMMIEGLEGLPQADERLALIDHTDEEDAAAATAVLEKIEDIKVHALQLSEQNMSQALGIIKSWLKDSTDNKLPAKAA